MTRIRRVLIANRGEIAVRIIRSCKRLGIESILAVSEADKNSTGAKLADQLIHIGPAPSNQSYLNIPVLVDAAIEAKADAVHPGYGFLSENVEFAKALNKASICFIGPDEEQLLAVGDKLKARQHAVDAGLPLIPGGSIDDPAKALKIAAEIGYPILIKAVGGGGGRGLKPVFEAGEMEEAVTLAMAEAEVAFGDGRLYLERYIPTGRHVEVQVLGDGKNIVHLGDRDCSIQRRYQKLVEEAPAPDLEDDLRAAMYKAATDLAKHLHYVGAGTVEFLVDCARGEFYFLEMNARIQVEHPVTEMITGIDLIEEQIFIAEGRALRYVQQDITLKGHAIECRINAEDVSNDFQPSPGRIERAVFPAGPSIRVDTHIETGVTVPPFYDSLLAKIITYGPDRPAAIATMAAALKNCALTGVKSNLRMQQSIMENKEFMQGAVDTTFFNQHKDILTASEKGGK